MLIKTDQVKNVVAFIRLMLMYSLIEKKFATCNTELPLKITGSILNGAYWDGKM
jgi:hypothetical protein